jgi:plasmid stability protein
MADVTIHDVDPEVLKRLEDKAQAAGHSLEDELRATLEERVPERSIEHTRRLARKWQERFRGRFFSDSTELIREDRER